MIASPAGARLVISVAPLPLRFPRIAHDRQPDRPLFSALSRGATSRPHSMHRQGHGARAPAYGSSGTMPARSMIPPTSPGGSRRTVRAYASVRPHTRKRAPTEAGALPPVTACHRLGRGERHHLPGLIPPRLGLLFVTSGRRAGASVFVTTRSRCRRPCCASRRHRLGRSCPRTGPCSRTW